MTSLTPPVPRKLPVWSTVAACYTAVARNFGQLVRISWLWLAILAPTYATLHWLDRAWDEDPDWLAWQLEWAWWLVWVDITPGTFTPIVEGPFLASIAVAWHRLLLRQERVTARAYRRLDRTVWLYLLYSLLLLALGWAPIVLPTALMAVSEAVRQVIEDFLVALDRPRIVALAILLGLPALLVLPRLSLVLPAVALGERLSPNAAWRISRGSTVRLALAASLCMLPSVFLLSLPSLLSLLVRLPWLLDFSWERIVGLMWITTPVRRFLDWVLNSFGYAVFNSLASAVLAIFAVTPLSLTYRFFAAPPDQSTEVNAP